MVLEKYKNFLRGEEIDRQTDQDWLTLISMIFQEPGLRGQGSNSGFITWLCYPDK